MIGVLFTLFLYTKAEPDQYLIHTVSNYKCDLGEGPSLDQTQNYLYHVDAFKGELYKLNLNDHSFQNHKLGHELTSIVIPIQSHKDKFLISLRNKVAIYNWVTRNIHIVAEVSPELKGKERFNDGKCDIFGRLFIGTVLEKSTGIVQHGGSVYRLDGNHFVKVATGFTLTNGMDWSNDGQTMYVNDSEGQKVYSFKFDLTNGTLANQNIFIDLQTHPDFKLTEYPDGMTIDAYDNIWIALYNGGRIVQVDPLTARVKVSISISAQKTTSLCFGGPNLNQMYVTTGSKVYETDSGKVFMISSSSKKFEGKRSGGHFEL